MPKPQPVCQVMCPSCPFRRGSKYGFLRADLSESALTKRSRICHSTGSSGILGNTHKPARLCRGARDLQLQVFHSIGFLSAATDAAWEQKLSEIKSNEQTPASKTHA